MELRERFKDQWYKWYSIIIPSISAIGCYCVYLLFPIDIFSTENISDALTSVITAEAIILSLFGIILPLLSNARENSKLVRYFFSIIDVNAFSNQLKRCVGTCFLSLLSCVGMFFVDGEQNMSFYMILFSVWIGLFVALLCRSYRFLSLIISMLFQEDSEKRK